METLGHMELTKTLWQFWPIKRELTICDTASPRGKFTNENAMALIDQVRDSWVNVTPLGHVELRKMLWHFWPVNKELTSYGTARPHAKFANKNAMALIGQVRDSWVYITPLGHMELTKTLWYF